MITFTPTCFSTTTTRCISERAFTLDLISGFHGLAGDFTGVRLGCIHPGTCRLAGVALPGVGAGDRRGAGVHHGDMIMDTDIGDGIIATTTITGRGTTTISIEIQSDIANFNHVRDRVGQDYQPTTAVLP